MSDSAEVAHNLAVTGSEDPVRLELNERLCREVLGIDPEIVTDITRKLAIN